MNDQVLHLLIQEITTSTPGEPVGHDVYFEKAMARAEQAAALCSSVRPDVDSMFAQEIAVATPGLKEPSLLGDTHRLASGTGESS